MSRRAPNPAADRAAQNQQTIKSLLKLEGNKSCADCKRNKHPRWASWNLGVFVCIRCSGIHRGMGTHVSRVKSVDLDAWTDEQLQSVLRWGNTRANKYWEAKLASGHVPSEAKIENFIRTKYDSKRWVMEGGMPDPTTLDDAGDEDMPLSVVQEKQKLDRSSSIRSSGSGPPPGATRAPQNVDLFGDDDIPAPRSRTAEPTTTRPPPPKGPAPAKQSKPGDSLLGLDFFGPTSSQSNSPSGGSAANTNAQAPVAASRPDLKQSILSLYASAPRQQPSQPQAPQQDSFSELQSPSSQQPSQQAAFGGLSDAFSGLGFASSTPNPAPVSPSARPKQQKPPSFANMGSFSQKSTPAAPSVGGGFFDPTPAPAKSSQPAPASHTSSTLIDSSFSSIISAVPPGPSSSLGDLFDFPSSSQALPAKPAVSSPPQQQSSVFNLSTPTAPSNTKVQTSNNNTAAAGTGSGWANSDAWGSNDVWNSSEATAAKPLATTQTATTASTSANEFGWGGSNANSNGGLGASGGFGTSSPPKVSADEDFGGWSSSTAPVATMTPSATIAPAKPASGTGGAGGSGFGGSEDLFSNVWE